MSLRVKRDERGGGWWLDGVDVSVMAWCQTLRHCQPHSTFPSMVNVSKFEFHCKQSTSFMLIVLTVNNVVKFEEKGKRKHELLCVLIGMKGAEVQSGKELSKDAASISPDSAD